MNEFIDCIKNNPVILMEGALGERLKREYGIVFDEHVAMASLVYSAKGRDSLLKLWNEYIDIAKRHDFPFIATTPTRRANKERISDSEYSEKIIADNVKFLKDVQKNCKIEMYAGALLGCKGDAYTGKDALTENEGYDFHSWSINHFVEAGADFLYAGIMPCLPEAAGLAKAASDSKLPYIISFTVQADGRLIDGTSIVDAICYIDEITENNPVCYMANCIHPDILYKALTKPFNDVPLVKKRFCGIQANTSLLSYAELDGSKDLKCSEPEDFACAMLRLKELGDFKIWGGCCGTDNRHMECLAEKLKF